MMTKSKYILSLYFMMRAAREGYTDEKESVKDFVSLMRYFFPTRESGDQMFKAAEEYLERNPTMTPLEFMKGICDSLPLDSPTTHVQSINLDDLKIN